METEEEKRERQEVTQQIHRMDKAAVGESFSAQLRRAIQRGPGLGIRDVARSVDVDVMVIQDFLEDLGPLPIPVIDRLVEILGLKLVSVHDDAQ